MAKKKSSPVNTKRKGVMEMARITAEKAKKNADKSKGKRSREPESDDELDKRKKNDETEEDESGDGKSDASDVSSGKEIEALENEAEVEEQTMELDTLHKNQEQIKVRIEAAKKKNEAKLTELKETLNAYPSVRYVLLYY